MKKTMLHLGVAACHRTQCSNSYHPEHAQQPHFLVVLTFPTILHCTGLLGISVAVKLTPSCETHVSGLFPNFGSQREMWLYAASSAARPWSLQLVLWGAAHASRREAATMPLRHPRPARLFAANALCAMSLVLRADCKARLKSQAK